MRGGWGARVLGLAIVLAGTLTNAAAEFRAVPGREYREYRNPVNPVKGEAVLGFAVVPTEAQQRAPTVRVLLPAAYKGEIHLQTATADGKFRGEGVYSGSTSDKEWVRGSRGARGRWMWRRR